MAKLRFYLKPARGKDYITLLPRDPDWGYVFWEVTAEGIARSKQSLINFGYPSTLVLRLYSVADSRETARNKMEFAEHELSEWLGSRMVLLGRPGSLHQAVLGFRGHEGTFSPLCRSAYVRSPKIFSVPPGPTRYVLVQPPAQPGQPLRVTSIDKPPTKLAPDSMTSDPNTTAPPFRGTRPPPEGE